MSQTISKSVLTACVALLAGGLRSQERLDASHPFDLIHVGVELTVDYSQRTFEGVATNTVLLSKRADSITLHCGKNLDVRSCEVDGRKAVCTREGDRLSVRPPAGFGGGET